VPHSTFGQFRDVFGRRVLGVAIGMHDPLRLKGVVACGHGQDVGDQFGAHVGGHRPADHLLVEAVDHRGQIAPACHVGMWVMSPTRLAPGRSAVKSRATTSGAACSGSPGIVVRLYGFGGLKGAEMVPRGQLGQLRGFDGLDHIDVELREPFEPWELSLGTVRSHCMEPG
jgi:hypothetical protein